MFESNEERDRDWAEQVPEERQPEPYEDYGWEPGESVLPEFRKPEVHLTRAELRQLRAERARNREMPEASEFYPEDSWFSDWSDVGPGPEAYGPVRRGSLTGFGPKGYRRSDERILEEIHYRLERHGLVDAREIVVAVQDGEVTMRGIVDTRRQRRFAEDAVASVVGVVHINNDLKVRSMLRGMPV
ncbi:MAG TPA: BON domain-containing protein [Anaerolineaceae bacterium]